MHRPPAAHANNYCVAQTTNPYSLARLHFNCNNFPFRSLAFVSQPLAGKVLTVAKTLPTASLCGRLMSACKNWRSMMSLIIADLVSVLTR